MNSELIHSLSLVSPEHRRRRSSGGFLVHSQGGGGGGGGGDDVVSRSLGILLLLLLLVFVGNDVVGDVSEASLEGNDGFGSGVRERRAGVD